MYCGECGRPIGDAHVRDGFCECKPERLLTGWEALDECMNKGLPPLFAESRFRKDPELFETVDFYEEVELPTKETE